MKRMSVFILFFSFFLIGSLNAAPVPPNSNSSSHDVALSHEHSKTKILVRFTAKELNRQESVKQGKSKSTGLPTTHALHKLELRGHTHVEKLTHRKHKKPHSKFSRWRSVTLPEGTTIKEAMTLFSNDPTAEVVEPNYIVRPNAIPNDPKYSVLWGMQTIDAEKAWDQQTGDGQVIVAVLDTGIDYTHEDLVNNMWVNPGEIPGNGIDDDNNGYIDDVYGVMFGGLNNDPMDLYAGHGTHVAGTIGAVGDNAIGVTGVNWNVKLMALRFMSSFGGTTTGAIEGIEYAVAMNAKVINASWGSSGKSIALEDAIKEASNAGVLFVAAAGNSSNDSDITPLYPAAFTGANIISVAASDANDNLATFSNYGINSVDLAAPGVKIGSTGAEQFCRGFSCIYFERPVYYYLSGTSMAAPHVAGAAALLWSNFPSLTNTEVKNILLQNVDTIPSMVGKVSSGGRLNLFRSLDFNVPEFDFNLFSSPSSFIINSGESASLIADIRAGLSFTGPITLDLVPANELITYSINQAVVNPVGGEVEQVSVNIFTAPELPTGDYDVQLIATDDTGRSKKSVISVKTVIGPELIIDISPTESYVTFGSSAEYVITLTSANNYSRTVSLEALMATKKVNEAMSYATDFPEGLSVSFDTNIINLMAGEQATVLMTVDTSVNTTLDSDFFIQLKISDQYQAQFPIVKLGIWRNGIDLIPSQIQLTENAPEASDLHGLENTTVLDAGLSHNIHWEVYNQGVTLSNQNFVSTVYLSTDNVLDSSDIILTYDPGFGNLLVMPGKSQAYTFHGSIDVASNVVPGAYYLILTIDSNNVITESDETNNTVVMPIEIINSIDLVPTNISLDKTSYGVNESVLVTTTISNLDASTLPKNYAKINYYLSKDTTYSDDDMLMGYNINSYRNAYPYSWESTFKIGEILPVSSINKSNSTKGIPASLPEGDYYLLAFVDAENTVNEGNEDNNFISAGPFRINNDYDLIVSDASLSKTTLVTGEKLDIQYTVNNIGTTNSSYFPLNVYLSSNGISLDRRINPNVTPMFLLPGGEFNGAFSVDMTEDMTSYNYVIFVASTGGSSLETNKNNNRFVISNFSLTPTDTDLTVSDFSSNLTSVNTGAGIIITSTIKNMGANSAAGYTVGLYLSTDSSITTTDTLIGNWVSSQSLSNGATESKSVTAMIPPSLTPGNYFIGAVSDKDNIIYEANETNNSTTGTAINVAQGTSTVDLVITSFIAPANGIVGTSLNVTYTIQNQGTTAITTPPYSWWGIPETVYLSTDNIITDSDMSMGFSDIKTLNPGQSITKTLSVSISASQPIGSYYIGVFTDSWGGGSLIELDESNNIQYLPIEIVTNTDLIISSVSSDLANTNAGSLLTINSTVQNIGADTVPPGQRTTLYLSSDRTINQNDIYLGDWFTTTDLANSLIESNTMSVTIPLTVASGNYYIGAIADTDNTFVEINEDNNSTESDFQIYITSAVNTDLIPTAVSSNVTTIASGQTVALSSGVTNVGSEANTNAFQVDLYLSTDNVITNADIFLSAWTTSTTLTSGLSEYRDVNIVIPDSLASGSYYFGAIVDGRNIIIENLETNNSLSSVNAVQVETCTVNGIVVDCITGAPVISNRAQLCPERVNEAIYGRFCDYRIPTLGFSAYKLEHSYGGAGFDPLAGFTAAYEMNDNSDIVGSAVTSTGEVHAVRMNVGDQYYSNLYFTDLGVSGVNSSARTVNNLLTFAGESEIDPTSVNTRETIWHSQIGNGVAINALGNERGVALGMARNSTYTEFMTGYSVWNNDPINSDGLEHGYLWSFDGTNQSVIRIGDVGETNRGLAVNDSQIVVGYAEGTTGNQAYYSTSGAINILDSTVGTQSQALDINNNVSTKIVGFTNDGAGTQQAVVWDNTVKYTLPALQNALNSAATAITDGGDIVGHSNNRAVFWRNGQVFDLNLLLNNALPVTITESIDINRRGRVLVKASDGSYYILIPQSESN